MERTDSSVRIRLTGNIDFCSISLAKVCRPQTSRQSKLVGWIGRLPKPLAFGESIPSPELDWSAAEEAITPASPSRTSRRDPYVFVNTGCVVTIPNSKSIRRAN